MRFSDVTKQKTIALISHRDGHLSTTKTIQTVGFVVLALLLMLSVLLNREQTSELYLIFASYCGGLTISKGVVSSYQQKGARDE
ncbi:MAG: DUF2644 domain-containing protein [Cardiobacteriaceae bacterium]|nr:DUF2644 domain-containing protein [Cardiobacteriaceae bacterium]